MTYSNDPMVVATVLSYGVVLRFALTEFVKLRSTLLLSMSWIGLYPRHITELNIKKFDLY